jgi:hypothetical protein
MAFLENGDRFAKINLFFNKFLKSKTERNFKDLCTILERKKPEIEELKNDSHYNKRLKQIFQEINNYQKLKKYNPEKLSKNKSRCEETDLLSKKSPKEEEDILERIYRISDSTLKNATDVVDMLGQDTETLLRCNSKSKNTQSSLKQANFFLNSIEKAQLIDKFYLYCVIMIFGFFDAFVFYFKLLR